MRALQSRPAAGRLTATRRARGSNPATRRRTRIIADATALVAATDAHFAWLLRGEPPVYRGLRVPPGGVDDASVVEHVRGIARRLADAGRADAWLVVSAGEVVGLCGYKAAPDARGVVEIGYNVAPARRRRGHATRAIGEMLLRARADPTVRALTAQVLVSNAGSERALAANSFTRIASWTDAREGPIGTWRADASPAPT